MTEEEIDRMTLAEFLEIIAAANPVFWVCPKGCRGTVEWNDSRTQATCVACGEQSEEKERVESTT